MKGGLPKAETLYAHFFGGWFPPEDPRDPLLRSDLEQIDLEEGAHIRVLNPLDPVARGPVEAQLERTTRAALADFPLLLKLQTPPGPDWLDALEAYAQPEKLTELLRASNPEKPDNPYLVLCCETGALLGHLLRQQWPALRWLADLPYFESCLFDLNAKLRIPVFHWAVKTLSGDPRAPLREKLKATLEFLREPV